MLNNMYNNVMLDDWIDAIDAYLYEYLDKDINSRVKINIMDKNYFEKLISDIPEFYNGKLIREKVKSYGEIGFISSMVYYIVFNMNDNSIKANVYSRFINNFTSNGNVNYQDIINYLIQNKEKLAGIFNEVVDIERNKILNKKSEKNNEVNSYIKLTDSIDVLKFTPQTQHILKWAGIYTIGELVLCKDLENIKYMKEKNLQEIKEKLSLLDFSNQNKHLMKNNLLIEKEILKNKIDELIDSDPESAYLFLMGAKEECNKYLSKKRK